MRSWKFAIGAAALALAACSSGPDATVEEFYAHVAEGRTEQARALMSRDVTNLLGDEKLDTALRAETRRIQECGGIANVEVELGEGESVRIGTATITYQGECAQRQEDVRVVKEDGDWKLGIAK